MQNVITNQSVAFVFIVSAMMAAGCYEASEPIDVGTASHAIEICDATLEISTQLNPSDSFHLCFRDDNCLEIYYPPDGCTLPVVNGCCLHPAVGANQVTCIFKDPEGADCDDPLQTDHPFVDHPDDWDTLYLRSNMASSLILSNLSIKYATKPDAYFYFVGSDPTGAGPFYSATLPQNSTLDLSKEIEARRKDAVLSAMGGGVSWEDLPVIVQKAAMDIGQSGLKKYSPMTWNRLTSASGCDEFFNYFGALYSNNINSLSTERSIFFPWGGTQSYQRQDGTIGWQWNSLTLREWIPSGRAAKVVFNDINPNDCQSISQYYVDTEGNLTGTPFTPKVGDYLIRVDNRKQYEDVHSCKDVGGSPYIQGSGNACCDAIGKFNSANEYTGTRNNTHIMMALGDTIRPSAVGKLCAGFPVIEGSGRVRVRGNACVQTACHAGNLVPCGPAPLFQDIPIHDYYFGEMDIETGGSRSGHNENNFGFVASMPAYI